MCAAAARRKNCYFVTTAIFYRNQPQTTATFCNCAFKNRVKPTRNGVSMT